MQFNVPQFTNDEDKVVGPLTVRQFLILLGAGALTFVGYSSSKNTVVTGIVAFFAFIPALILAFGQFNGRHMYMIIPVFFKFFFLPKKYVFEKEAVVKSTTNFAKSKASQQMQADEAKNAEFPDNKDDIHSRLKKIQYQLEARNTQEKNVLETVKPKSK